MGASRKNRRTDYLVQWKDSPESKATWERDVTLLQFEWAMQAYLQAKSTRASTSIRGGGFITPPRMPRPLIGYKGLRGMPYSYEGT